MAPTKRCCGGRIFGAFLRLERKMHRISIAIDVISERCSFRFSDHDKREYFKDSSFFFAVSPDLKWFDKLDRWCRGVLKMKRH